MLPKYSTQLTLGILALIGLSSTAQAGIITQQSAIETIILSENNNSELIETNVNNTNFEVNYEDSSANLSLKADTTTGVVGVSSYSKGDSGQAMITIFDTIEFSSLQGPTSISYNFGVDGSLYTDSLFDSAYFQSFVKIYDITGMQSWLESESFFGIFDDTEPVSNATELSETSFFQRTQEREYGLLTFDEILSGSFIAEQGKTYGIAITANAFSTGENAYADFLNTSTFSFSDLGGATFTSGSGAFLNPVSVPEPSALALFGLSLTAFGFRRVKKS